MKKLLIFTSVSIFSSYVSASIVSSNELALALMNTKHVSFDDVLYVTPKGDINIKVLKKIAWMNMLTLKDSQFMIPKT